MASATKTVTTLSSNDAWVLNSVFNPETSLAQSRPLINPHLSNIPHGLYADLNALQKAELIAIRPLNCPEPSRDLIETAVAELTNLIDAHPTYASAYNNRAQALALLSDNANNHRVWSDVGSAIRLASPPSSATEVSKLQAAVLAAAHTQRAKLLWLTSQSERDIDSSTRFGGTSQVDGLQWEDVCRLGRQELEERANRDFEMAGHYGNENARKMGIITNPYGKLCGAIVREAMQEEMGKAMAFER